MSCAFGAGNKFPSPPIQEKFIDALKRSLFQSPASSFLISEIGMTRTDLVIYSSEITYEV